MRAKNNRRWLRCVYMAVNVFQELRQIGVQVAWNSFILFSSCCVEGCFLVGGTGCAPGHEESGDFVGGSGGLICGANIWKPFESVTRIVEKASEYLHINITLSNTRVIFGDKCQQNLTFRSPEGTNSASMPACTTLHLAMVLSATCDVQRMW